MKNQKSDKNIDNSSKEDRGSPSKFKEFIPIGNSIKKKRTINDKFGNLKVDTHKSKSKRLVNSFLDVPTQGIKSPLSLLNRTQTMSSY